MADHRTGERHDGLPELWAVAGRQFPTKPSVVVESAKKPDRHATTQ
jgi:hypothetical protein